MSDDFVAQSGTQDFAPCFTGDFYGLCCQDLSGSAMNADFSVFEYRELS